MAIDTRTLHIDADISVLIDAQKREVVLHVSPRTIMARHWPLGWPAAIQLERAIDDVENAIERSGLVHAHRSVLKAGDGLRAMLRETFGQLGTVIRDDVEAAFSRLVASSERPGAHAATGGEAAAALLLVREVMHHLGFQALQTDS